MINIPNNSVINFTDTAEEKDTTNKRLELWHILFEKYALYKDNSENTKIEEQINYILIGSEV
jgi:hypothetical protein